MAYETIVLTPSEMLSGAMAGVMRQVENCKLQRTPAHGAGNLSDWQINIEGCLGEMALAKFLNLYWPGKGAFRGDDVGHFQVRTAAGHGHRLILHPDDDDDKRFYLVTGGNGVYRIHGFILGRNGKKPSYWSDPSNNGRPAYFVPQTALVMDY